MFQKDPTDCTAENRLRVGSDRLRGTGPAESR